MITITHIPTGKEKSFAHGREATEWLRAWDEQKMAREDLRIINMTGISLTAYDPKIPLDAQNLIEALETAFGGNKVPRWHWMNKDIYNSTGRTIYKTRKEGGGVSHVAISANDNSQDYLGVICHEYAHALAGHDDGHNRTFYRILFALLRRFVDYGTEQHSMTREFVYKKSSRYWYAEMYNITHILSEYQPRTIVAASRLTAEQKEAAAMNKFFEGEN